jgi:hypothetical protein
MRPAVPRLAVAGNGTAEPAMADDEFEQSFSRALARLGGDGTVIDFPQGTPAK